MIERRTGIRPLSPLPLTRRRIAWFSVVIPALVGTAAIADRADRAVKTATSPQARSAETPPTGMVRLPAGRFRMGSSDAMFPDARPIHTVAVAEFYLDRCPVTNARFARFVHASGYVTVAERRPDPQLFPGVPKEQLVPGSVVFTPPPHPVPLDDPSLWWRYVPGANWQHPEGPGSKLAGRENHPVVQVCWADAAAYARWAGKRLPTEAEWEYAARGGLAGKEFVWGDTPEPHGRIMANTFQGSFPDHDTRRDGYARTSPVGAFPANGYGLYDMSGNVWEWCADWYRPDYYAHAPGENPPGPSSSFDPSEPGQAKRVQRGGSFLCTDAYCGSYRPGARGKGDPLTGASNVGFRCAVSLSAARGVRRGE